jgi:nucleoside-diphosphate-sugar epimerase
LKVAVTGAGGFIGHHVVTQLEQIGVSPTVVIRSGSTAPTTLAGHRLVEMDLAVPPSDAYDQLGEPDVLIHLAWGGLPRYQSPHHRETELPQQRSFLQGLLASGLSTLTVTGTCFEYGMQSGALREDMSTAPVTQYGMAKDELRAALEDLRTARPYRLTWARLFYLRGEGQSPSSLLPQLEAAIAHGDAVFNMSGGEQLRDYLPVQEAARYLVVLALNGRDNGVVNVCSGHPVSVRDLAEAVVRDHGSSIQLNLGHFPYPEYEPMAFWGDRSKLDRCLGLIDETIRD